MREIIPFFREAGISREGLTAVPIKARVWSRLGSFDHHLPVGPDGALSRLSSVRRPSKEFAEWMEDSLQGDLYYDAHYFEGDHVKRARWIMLFTHEVDAVAFVLRWL